MLVLPNWVYEPLPYIYTSTGLVSAVMLDSMMGRMSGILLITAGFVIVYQRYEYRRLKKEREERQAWLQEQAHRKKMQRQAWLRDQAQRYREEIERKKDDF